MGKHKKTFTRQQLQERAKVESELWQIKPMCALARKITSTEGFVDYYLQIRNLYESYYDAYEFLEEIHTMITGRRKYVEYLSFRGVILKVLKKHKASFSKI